MSKKKRLFIHGIRGIPANHGGFESFTEKLAPYLVEKGWEVTVYCQELGTGPSYSDTWNGVNLIHVPVSRDGSFGSLIFDWLTIRDAIKKQGMNLTLGYNTAIFSLLYRLHGKINLFNMDGVEWKRQKWSLISRIWFFINECLGSWLGNHLIADHPEISKHLQSRVNERKITVIPYCADRINDADESVLEKFNLEKYKFFLLVARPEPENSIFEIVKAYSAKPRNNLLVILGNFDSENNAYHKKVMDAASSDVKFVGAIYDQTIVNSFRVFTRLYIHGHQVGGTNPSLVESLGAGSPVLAHDNRFNRWVAGKDAHYFKDVEECERIIDRLDSDDVDLEKMRNDSYKRHAQEFSGDGVLSAYNELLTVWHDKSENGVVRYSE